MNKENNAYTLPDIRDDYKKNIPILMPCLPIHSKEKPIILPLLPEHREIKPTLYEQNPEEKAIKKNIRISRHGIIFS
jgi:hypothetical protein